MDEVYLPHVGWLEFDPSDDVLTSLRTGVFEHREQAFFWRYLRDGDSILDCGAHVGLFSTLAAAAVHGRGTILAVEPTSTNVIQLRKNLQANEIKCVEIIEAAAASRAGHAELQLGREGKSASSTTSLTNGAQAELTNGRSYLSPKSLQVPTVVLDELITERGLNPLHLVKVDVEGAKIEVLRGLRHSLLSGLIKVAMIEFSERWLRRAGQSLFDELGGYGLQVCHFNSDRWQLEPAEFEGPIWHDNLFVTAQLDWVNGRLAGCDKDRHRIAHDILMKGMVRWESLKQLQALQKKNEQLERQHIRDCERTSRAERRVAELDGRMRIREPEFLNNGCLLRSSEPAFGGWESAVGLGPVEGPFPKSNLPKVCWGLDGVTRLTVRVKREEPLLLVIDARTNWPDQEIAVTFDGQPLAGFRLPVPYQFTQWLVPFRTLRGDHQLELNYAHSHKDGDRSCAVLYRQLCIIPDCNPLLHRRLALAEARAEGLAELERAIPAPLLRLLKAFDRCRTRIVRLPTLRLLKAACRRSCIRVARFIRLHLTSIS